MKKKTDTHTHTDKETTRNPHKLNAHCGGGAGVRCDGSVGKGAAGSGTGVPRPR